MPRGSVEAQAILSEADAVGYRAEDLGRWQPNENPWSVHRALERIAGGRAGVVFVGPTAPVDPADGQLWLDTSTTGTGGLGVLAVVTITADLTLTTSHLAVFCDASGGAIVVTLPAASANTGRRYFIKKIDSSANTVTIEGNANETIDNAMRIVISEQYVARFLASDNSNWWVL